MACLYVVDVLRENKIMRSKFSNVPCCVTALKPAAMETRVTHSQLNENSPYSDFHYDNLVSPQ